MLKFLVLLFIIVGCATKPSHNDLMVKGKTHSGEEVVVNLQQNAYTTFIFMSSRCPCSESHNDIVNNLLKKYSDIKFVGVHSNYNEKLKHAKNYFESLDFDFPVIYDQDSHIAKKYGAVKTPHVFIVNSKGETVYSGSVTNSSNGRVAKTNFLKIALDDIEGGSAPKIAQRTSLGCYIPIKE